MNVAEMMFLAGVAVGGLVSGMVSDRYSEITLWMLFEIVSSSV